MSRALSAPSRNKIDEKMALLFASDVDRLAYTDGKATFIAAMLQLAASARDE